ncbi:hypothetical protein SCH4B_4809 [Ruegeria sp. TrichCH4B]|nr:hypothetical protein SCH4B_4809 [Ruegeria sp. TrichCH4B]
MTFPQSRIRRSSRTRLLGKRCLETTYGFFISAKRESI